MILNKENGTYKSGRSNEPHERVKQLRNSTDDKLALVLTIAAYDATSIERMLHAMFDHLRLDGEWFRLTQEHVDLLANIDFVVGPSRKTI